MSNLENKNIIVTGASGGIGNSIIKKLNEVGANILASGTRMEKLEELKKNFKNIKSIALAKSEIIHNTKPKGCIVLNADDSFFKFHKTLALKKKLRVISFGIKNKKSTISLSDINRNGKNFLINIEYNNLKKSFLISLSVKSSCKGSGSVLLSSIL